MRPYRIVETHLPFYHRYYLEVFNKVVWVSPYYLEGNGFYIENKFRSLAELRNAVKLLTEEV